jgi:hypothetical protein
MFSFILEASVLENNGSANSMSWAMKEEDWYQ